MRRQGVSHGEYCTTELFGNALSQSMLAVPSIGGSATFTVDSATAFQKVYVTVPGKTGFILADLGSPRVDQGILLKFNDLPASVTLQFQVATAAG